GTGEVERHGRPSERAEGEECAEHAPCPASTRHVPTLEKSRAGGNPSRHPCNLALRRFARTDVQGESALSVLVLRATSARACTSPYASRAPSTARTPDTDDHSRDARSSRDSRSSRDAHSRRAEHRPRGADRRRARNPAVRRTRAPPRGWVPRAPRAPAPPARRASSSSRTSLRSLEQS